MLACPMPPVAGETRADAGTSTVPKGASARAGFLVGVATTLMVILLFGGFLALRVGPERLLSRIRDTILVEPGGGFGWILRPSVEVEATVLRARGSLVAPFALYFDRGHLSRYGSRRVARAVAEALARGGAG